MSSRVLVVEDDPAIGEVLEQLLRRAGHEVTIARDGMQGLLQLQGGGFDLVLLDLMMPDIDGLHVLRELLVEGEGVLARPVVVVTGSESDAVVARALLGGDDVLRKPFDVGALLARVDHHLGPSAQPTTGLAADQRYA